MLQGVRVGSIIIVDSKVQRWAFRVTSVHGATYSGEFIVGTKTSLLPGTPVALSDGPAVDWLSLGTEADVEDIRHQVMAEWVVREDRL